MEDTLVPDDDFIEEEDYKVNIYSNIERNLRSYSGFVSLLRELIQNADDSSTNGETVEVEIHFFKDKLVLKNNTVFSENDWIKIIEIGSRNKEADTSKTGRFGIGFTSVFKICDILNIHSTNKSRKVDLNQKEKWKTYRTPKYTSEKITEFEFFWRKEESYARKEIGAEIITQEKIDLFVVEVLRNIQDDIHFLNHLAKLDIYKNGNLIHKIRIENELYSLSRDLNKEIKRINIDETKKRMVLYHKNIENHFETEYKNGIARRRPFLISIAFNGTELQKGRFFCTLPTELNTGFAFDINSDFQPDQNRKHLIFDEDDSKGKYNLKIIDFVPAMIDEIIDDLKAEVNPDLFYQILYLSKQDGEFNYIYSRFIDLVKKRDCNIIYINNEWYPISLSKITRDTSILKLLTRINCPVVPGKYIKYRGFFKKIGVDEFNLNDLICLIQEKIPHCISFEESIFISKDELYSIYSYISKKIEINNDYKTKYIENIRSLNIFLTTRGCLESNNNFRIKRIPKQLDAIKNELPVTEIDAGLVSKCNSCLAKLGVSKLNEKHLIKIIKNDFADAKYPIKINETKRYINNRQKLISIIHFIEKYIYKYNEYKKAKNIGFWSDGEKRIDLKDQRFINFESTINDMLALPLALTDDNLLYPLKNHIVYDLSKSNYKKQFADKKGLKNLDSSIRELFPNILHQNFFKLTIDVIIDHFEFDLEKNGTISDDDIILLYQLISEEQRQLDRENIDRLKRMSIFKNNNLDYCSLEDDGNEMVLKGNYPVPKGIQIDDILDEAFLDNVPDFPRFKQTIIKSMFGIKELNFEVFIKKYLEEIFHNSKVEDQDKFDLIDKLNDQFIGMTKKNSYSEIESVLVNTKLIYCNDGKFHCPTKESVFFKSRELDELFGKNYIYPEYNDINSYKHFFEQMGVKNDLNLDDIVEYVVESINTRNISHDLIERMKIVFNYINKHWDTFDENTLSSLEKLADIEWLPAVDCNYKLYKPKELYLGNIQPLLSEFNDVLYFDMPNSSQLKTGFVKIIGLNYKNIIPTEMIIKNLKQLSSTNKLIDKQSSIYSELEKRSNKDPISVKTLQSFRSISIKYEGEKKPRYFSPAEVFKHECSELYGYEYIGYLPSEFVQKYSNLIECLNIADEPYAESLKNILKLIELKYHEKNYCITDDNDRKIVYNCLTKLSKDAEISSIEDAIIYELQNMHILINNKSQLITPKYAILDDNRKISDQFRNQLKDRFLRYNDDHLELFEKLEINKISQMVHKELINRPSPNSLELNEAYTKKMELFAQLFQRIKIGNKGDHTSPNKHWKHISSKIKVYNYDNLQISTYIFVDDIKYKTKDDNAICCYMETDEGTINEIYVRGSIEEISDGIASELSETLHPNLDNNFINTAKLLLQKNSLEEMHNILDGANYPTVDEIENTNLINQKNIENILEKEDEEKDEDDMISESPLNNIEYSSENQSNEDITESPNKFKNRTFFDDGDKDNFSENCSHSDKEELHTKDSNEDMEMKESFENKSDSKKSSYTDKDKGRTRTPTKDMNFKQAIEKQYNGKDTEDNIHFYAIDENLEPMTIEEERKFNGNVHREFENEIESIQYDNSRRAYNYNMEKLADNQFSKFKVKDNYKGKCQICGFTFRTKNKHNYCITASLLEKRNGGIRHPANYLCLCPNHAALIKHGNIKFKNLDDPKDNKVLFTDFNSSYEIKYDPIHFKMLKEMLKRGSY